MCLLVASKEGMDENIETTLFLQVEGDLPNVIGTGNQIEEQNLGFRVLGFKGLG